MSIETFHLIVIGLVVVGVFLAFFRDWASPDVIAMTGLVVVVVAGILSPRDVLAVFSNSAPITIGAMFVLSAALERTGAIDTMARAFERLAGRNEIRALLLLMLMAALLSAFVNNTPVVIVFLPIVLGLSRTTGMKPSRFLIPLSFASMLGGTVTLIGTSTNLLVDGLAQEFGQKPFGIFEVTKLGILYAIAGILYLATIGRRLLPDRETLSSIVDFETTREYLIHAIVSKGSALIGKSLAETRLAGLREARVVEVQRQGSRVMDALDKLRFREGDQLLLKAIPAGVEGLKEVQGLAYRGLDEEALGLKQVDVQEARLVEAIIGPSSALVGKTLSEVNFRQKYGAIVLAVHREGQNLRAGFADEKLSFGDTLLVEGSVDSIKRLMEERDFISLSEPRKRAFRRGKAPLAIAAIVAVVALSMFSTIPIAVLALMAAIAVVLFHCVEPGEAYQAVDWKILFLIFGMLAIGFAVEETGAASRLAHAVIALVGAFPPIVILSCVYLMTVVITELISNNATAVLLTPLVLQIAEQMGLDGRPFVVAVMFGASACFATPIGYQTNTYVYGAGGYRFTDFLRVGLPLNLLLWGVATLVIPWFWPLIPR